MFGKILGDILETTVKTTEILLKPVEVAVDLTKDAVSTVHEIFVEEDRK